ncbi:MAG TPA: hypothetical protein VGV12_13760 [Gemmatimonadales bacterium]|nr:hypothetical protein [Gemmatimonadales bacterium]
MKGPLGQIVIAILAVVAFAWFMQMGKARCVSSCVAIVRTATRRRALELTRWWSTASYRR